MVRAYDSRVPVPKPRPASRTDPTSEPERMLAQLVTAQRMEALARLVPGLAHELNNPLQAIIGVQRAARSTTPPSRMSCGPTPGSWSRRRDAPSRSSTTSWISRRRRPPERHPTRLGVLVERILELQSYQLSGGIAVDVDIPTDLPPVPLDRAAMQQVVLNLTQNAIEALRAGPGRGTLRIAARQAESAAGTPVARLAFADDGPGVAEEDRDRLFEPFFTTKDPDEHTGLGLFVSLGIVAGHGGSLTFEPGPDGGSVFTARAAARSGRRRTPTPDRHRSRADRTATAARGPPVAHPRARRRRIGPRIPRSCPAPRPSTSSRRATAPTRWT